MAGLWLTEKKIRPGQLLRVIGHYVRLNTAIDKFPSSDGRDAEIGDLLIYLGSRGVSNRFNEYHYFLWQGKVCMAWTGSEWSRFLMEVSE